MSRGPQTVGLCQGDLAATASMVNAAQQRLILAKAGGDEGWFGSWSRMVFNVNADGTLTVPREVARLEQMTVCGRAVRIQNQFFEFLDFGIGLQPQACCNFLETYERGVFPTFTDIAITNKKVRVRLTDANDAGRRVLIQGTDENSNTIYSLDGLAEVQGTFLTLISPFVDTDMQVSTITGIQKDVTFGPVNFYEVDVTDASEKLILTMEPGEKIAAYRRYFINGLPSQCCDSTQNPLQVTAMAKLDFIPVSVDTDYLLIPNIEALIEECQSIRYSTMDTPAAAGLADKHHRDAIRLLQGELTHFLGKQRPAINFSPFGSAHLVKQGIGTLT